MSNLLANYGSKTTAGAKAKARAKRPKACLDITQWCVIGFNMATERGELLSVWAQPVAACCDSVLNSALGQQYMSWHLSLIHI